MSWHTSNVNTVEGARAAAINLLDVHKVELIKAYNNLQEGTKHDAVVASSVVVAFSLAALGREQDALALLADKDKSVPPRIRGILRAMRALLEGRRDEAIAAIHAIASDFRDAGGVYYLARQLSYAGAADEAMRLLERATDAGFWCYPLLASDEWLDPLRHRPDFADVLRRAKQERDLASAAFTSVGGDQILGSD